MGGICSSKPKRSDDESEGSPYRPADRASTKTDASKRETSEERRLSNATLPPSQESTKLSLSISTRVDEAKEPEKMTPDGLKNFSSAIKSIIHGDLNVNFHDKQGPWRERGVTLMFCSNESGSNIERRFLKENIFIPLKTHCQKRDTHLNIVDLHPGTPAFFKNHPKFDKFYLETLKYYYQATNLIVILLLNNDYSNTGVPPCLAKTTYNNWISKLDVTEKDFESLYLDQIPASDNVVLKPNFLEDAVDNQEDDALSERIHSSMVQCFSNEEKQKYFSPLVFKAIDQLLHFGTLGPQQTIWINKTYSQLPDSFCPEFEDTGRKIAKQLNENLDEMNMLSFTIKWEDDNDISPDKQLYLEDLCAQMKSVTISLVDHIIGTVESHDEDFWPMSISHRVMKESWQHILSYKQLLERCSSCFSKTLSEIKSFLLNNSDHVLILRGKPGSGKSTVLAEVLHCCREWLSHDVHIICRQIGATTTSLNPEWLYVNILEHYCLLYDDHPYYYLQTYFRKDYAGLRKLMSHPSLQRPLLIVLDGIERLEEFDVRDLNWLIQDAREGIKVIICLSDGGDTWREIQDHEKLLVLEMEQLTSDSCDVIINENNDCNQVPPDVTSQIKVLTKSEPTPLMTKSLLHTYWVSGFSLDLPFNSVISILQYQLDFLKKRLGKMFDLVLGYLCCSRYGVSEMEIVDLLHLDSRLKQPFYLGCDLKHADKVPHWLWHYVVFSLSPWLQRCMCGDISLIKWRYESIKNFVLQSYLSAEDVKQFHLNICSFFQEKSEDTPKNVSPSAASPIPSTKLDTSSRNMRSLFEFSYQVYRTSGIQCLRDKYLLNSSWLENNIRRHGVFQVLTIVEFALREESDCNLELLHSLLTLSKLSLHSDGAQFCTQVFGRLIQYWEDVKNQTLYSRVYQLFKDSSCPESPCFLPLSSCMVQPFQENREQRKASYFDNFFLYKYDPNYFVSVSVDKGTVVLWDVDGMRAVRTLNGLKQPRNLKFVDQSTCVILCNRELMVYNLDSGQFVTKLKGVMNQNMPYYDLHDSDHVVALARNRMYVNMINISSGECVATFKVGEDRFLNSLLVSENGQICVCGDETQKPFPLLVWDLSSRKLLHDLRIPHHEFLTRMAGTTEEGRYVASVCREVDDTVSNFVVVYDLINGTLFKKWKPSVDIVSLAISAVGEEGVVVCGLKDGRILTWDLITGCLKWTLLGHTSPPDSLQLGKSGTVCLSCNSKGLDPSVRVWDLNTGSLLAVYTSDVKITAWKLLLNGDVVVLGLQGDPTPRAFLLCHKNGVENVRKAEPFGTEDNFGKIFETSQA